MGLWLLGLWLSGLLLAACSETPPSAPPPLPEYRSVKVTIRHVYDPAAGLDSLVRDVEVRLFDERDFFVANVSPESTRISDSTGLANFEFRTKPYYWLRTIHPVLGELTDSVDTPAGTVSFVEIRYL